MKTKTIIQIIIGLSFYFSVAALADLGTQKPGKSGISLRQISSSSIEKSELNKKIDQCLKPILKDYTYKITKNLKLSSRNTIENNYYFTPSKVITEAGSCIWRLGEEELSDKKNYMWIKFWRNENPCDIRSKKINADQDNLNPYYSLYAKEPPRIVCLDSNEVQGANINAGEDQDQARTKTYLSHCFVTNYDGKKIEFYNLELITMLKAAGMDFLVEIDKPSYVYPRKKYVQCLQEAINHEL